MTFSKQNTVEAAILWLKLQAEHDPKAKKLYELFMEWAKWLEEATKELGIS